MTLDHDGLAFGGELARRHPTALNVLLVGVYVAVVASLSLTSADGTGGASNAGPRIVAAATMGLPLLGRTRWPLPVFVATLALSSLALVAGIARDWFVGPALALYEVADRAPSTRSELTRAIVIATAAIAVALVVAGSAAPPSQILEGIAVGAVVLGVGWILGWVGRERREYRAAAAAAQVQQAVAEERLRVAREIHDVVAHGVSLIVVRASVASHVMDRRPDEARDALAMIETTGRESLRELRRVVGALRAGDPPDGAPAEVEPPLGGPADLRAIADAVAPAGVRVELDADDLAPLSPLVAATVHRVVQEALTNVVRHAAPRRAGSWSGSPPTRLCCASRTTARAPDGGPPASARRARHRRDAGARPAARGVVRRRAASRRRVRGGGAPASRCRGRARRCETRGRCRALPWSNGHRAGRLMDRPDPRADRR